MITKLQGLVCLERTGLQSSAWSALHRSATFTSNSATCTSRFDACTSSSDFYTGRSATCTSRTQLRTTRKSGPEQRASQVRVTSVRKAKEGRRRRREPSSNLLHRALAVDAGSVFREFMYVHACTQWWSASERERREGGREGGKEREKRGRGRGRERGSQTLFHPHTYAPTD